MTTFVEPIRRSFERTVEQTRPIRIETGTMPAAAKFSDSVLLQRPDATSTSVKPSVTPELSVSWTSPVDGATQDTTRSFQWKRTPLRSIAVLIAADMS